MVPQTGQAFLGSEDFSASVGASFWGLELITPSICSDLMDFSVSISGFF